MLKTPLNVFTYQIEFQSGVLPATFPRPSSLPGAAEPDGQESKLDLKEWDS